MAVGHEGATALHLLDQSLLAQLVVSTLHRAQRQTQLPRQFPDGGQLHAVFHDAAFDVGTDPVHQLAVDRNAFYKVNLIQFAHRSAPAQLSTLRI